jgi:hypothetical protein
VGCRHDKPNGRDPHRPRRPRPRICLRKGCGRRYQPRRWNQRYCQDPECLRLVRRWQAAQRQARRRQDDSAKAQHAEAQRARRQRAQSVPQPLKQPEAAAARGHAAKKFFRCLCATGRGAMNRPGSRAATRQPTAAMPAARRLTGYGIVNASGCSVAPSRAAKHARGNTRPLAPVAAASHRTWTGRRPPSHRRRNCAHPPRRSAVDGLAAHAP